MHTIKFVDKTKDIIKRVTANSIEVQSRWAPEKLKMFTTVMGNLSDDPKDFILLGPGVNEGEFVIRPGFKLELIDRILKGEVELPRVQPVDEML